MDKWKECGKCGKKIPAVWSANVCLECERKAEESIVQSNYQSIIYGGINSFVNAMIRFRDFGCVNSKSGDCKNKGKLCRECLKLYLLSPCDENIKPYYEKRNEDEM